VNCCLFEVVFLAVLYNLQGVAFPGNDGGVYCGRGHDCDLHRDRGCRPSRGAYNNRRDTNHRNSNHRNSNHRNTNHHNNNHHSNRHGNASKLKCRSQGVHDR